VPIGFLEIDLDCFFVGSGKLLANEVRVNWNFSVATINQHQ
jgi:hypothetical protein